MSAPLWLVDVTGCQPSKDHIRPHWFDGVPLCALEACPRYDGKRCELLGLSPGQVCEVAVKRMAKRLDSLQGG